MDSDRESVFNLELFKTHGLGIHCEMEDIIVDDAKSQQLSSSFTLMDEGS